MNYLTVESPVGALTLVADGDFLVGLEFPTSRGEPAATEPGATVGESPVLSRAAEQLGEYFAGTRRTFDLPLKPAGTEFQRRVWNQLCQIPFGQTISYGELARRVGNANASRAVGLANGRNPIAIVIPCHRVIGANGSLTGFGGGLETKRVLLELEGASARNELFANA